MALNHHRPEAPEGLAQAGGAPHDRSRRGPRPTITEAAGSPRSPSDRTHQAEPQGQARLGEEARSAAHVHQSQEVEQSLGVLELDPVQQFRIVVLRRIHARRDRPHCHGLGRERPEQIRQRLVSAEPLSAARKTLGLRFQSGHAGTASPTGVAKFIPITRSLDFRS